MVTTRWAAGALALSLAFLHGCGMDDAQQGKVRLVNATATTDFPTLALYRQDSNGNDVGVLSGVAAGSVSGYTDIDRGSYTFDIGTTASATPASSTSGTVGKQHDYTLFSYLTGTSLQTTFLSDDEDSPNNGKAKLRIFNAASTEVGAVDVFLVDHDCTALVSTDTAFLSSVSALQTTYKQLSATSSGTNWHVCVTAAGQASDVRLNLAQVTFRDQEIVTLVLTRTASGVLLNAATLEQKGALTTYPNAIARVRLVADADDTSGLQKVTASLNGVSLAADLPSPALTSYVTVPAGALTTALQISQGVAPQQTDVAINGVTLPAATAGADYTLLVAGAAGSPTVQLLADNNTAPTSTSLPVKVRLVNGVNGTSGTASANVGGTLVANNVAFGAASAYTSIAAVSGTTVNATANATVLTATNQQFVSGHVYTVFLYGAASAPQIAITQDH